MKILVSGAFGQVGTALLKQGVQQGFDMFGMSSSELDITNLLNVDTVFAQVDSGFNHLIRPMLYGSHHEIQNVSNPKGKERFYTVVGYICETDTFGSNRKIAEISEGDVLAFKNAGAYCFTMASNYNSRYRPAEVLWHEDKAHLIRKEEQFEDLLRNQILLDFKEKVAAN